MTRFTLAAPLALGALLLGCQTEDESPPEIPEDEAVASEAPQAAQDAFWGHLQDLCEAAHEGELLRAPEGDDQVDPDARLVVHFWECDDERLRFPFHVGDDRSRTWVLIRHEDGIELRHDHRHEDGTEEETTWYGAVTANEGTPNRQEFGQESEGAVSGWRIEIEPGERFTYGTIAAGEWRHHLEFDLTEEVELPELPWGHEELPSGLR